MLINLLGLHSGVTAWYETKCLVEALRWLRVINLPSELELETGLSLPQQPRGFGVEPVAARMRFQMEAVDARMRGDAPSGKGGHERYPLGADRIHYSLQEALQALAQWQTKLLSSADSASVACATGELFRWLGIRHLAAEPAAMLINKTPETPRFGRELKQCFGPCKIIHLIRDGRAVVRSAVSLGWGEPRYIAYLWRGLITQARESGRDAPADYLETRYEDLVLRPASELDRVCAFLGLPPEGERIVDEYQRRAGVPIAPSADVAPPRQVDPISQIVEREAGALLTDLGYLA